ncbi:MAG: hypothetical protein JWN76_2161 [Chitinophagaceae bacterium]|nr:hypothetical protein [Chitinophagaceae bacterium]
MHCISRGRIVEGPFFVLLFLIVEREKHKKSFFHYLPVWGCICTGIVYAAIGIIAILSFLRIKNGGADEGSLLIFLDKFFIGKIFIVVIMSGMISYIIWRIYETVTDPYGYGNGAKGIMRRTVTALSSFADAFIAYSAMLVLLGKGNNIDEAGQPIVQREFTGNLLHQHWGAAILLSMGAITCITALIQFGYVIIKGYMERMDIDGLASGKKTLIHITAWAGHFGRGVILGIIGFSFIKAAISKNAMWVVNTDKAFDFIGDHIGHPWFILISLATICYGIFMFVFGLYYDSDKD